MLTEVTRRLKFLVAFRPGLTSPLLAAQMAATFQRYSQGRLLLNVVTGGESAEQRAYGDFLPKAERYRRCTEFLEIIKRLWFGEGVLPILRRRGRWQHPAPGSGDESAVVASSAPSPGPVQRAAVS
jgi:alkanesulfonate monooxygenase SsuD/methylene tetrahydromethanopterin reductase-like flavin-dependent oxidoreductase (luciferase family)